MTLALANSGFYATSKVRTIKCCMSSEPDFYIDHTGQVKQDSKPPEQQPQSEEVAEHASHSVVESSRREYLKFFGIVLFLLAASTLMSGLSNFNVSELMRWFMGGFFIVFGSFKLIGYESFVLAFRQYDILGKRYRPYAPIYPFIELILGVCYVLNMAGLPRDIFTVIIMGLGAIGVSSAISKKERIQCACLGNIIRLPLTTVSLVEDLLMVAMAIIMILTTIFT